MSLNLPNWLMNVFKNRKSTNLAPSRECWCKGQRPLFQWHFSSLSLRLRLIFFGVRANHYNLLWLWPWLWLCCSSLLRFLGWLRLSLSLSSIHHIGVHCQALSKTKTINISWSNQYKKNTLYCNLRKWNLVILSSSCSLCISQQLSTETPERYNTIKKSTMKTYQTFKQVVVEFV